MIRLQPLTWGLAIGGIAVLNVLEILPDWTTVAAVLMLPLLAASNLRGCAARTEDAR